MNVSLRHFIAFWFLLFTSFALYSQAIVLETYQNTPLVHTFSSSPFSPQIPEKPENGTAKLLNLGNNQYEIVYEPNEGFVGADELVYNYWSPPTNFMKVTVYINVLPSVVTAVRDFAGTPSNISVDIDVLSNDETTSSSLSISNISLINNGEVIVSEDGSVLTFVPDPDFQGIAHFNYIACDEAGACDQGTVSINVYGENNSDTLKVFTKKNQPQAIFIPSSFSLVEEPWNGFYDDYEDIPQYYPDMDYVGNDYIVFENNGMVKVVEIVVLDMVDNTFANDDDVFTTSYNSVEFNVLENDLYGINAGCFSYDQPLYGTLEVVEGSGGTLIYIPTEGFTGVDKFTYRSQDPDCFYGEEEATVFVYVSNFEPVYNRFKMSTVRATPLVVAYSIPISEYRFEINQQPSMGKVLFLEGQADTTINGQRIKGYNLLIYVPGEDVVEGQDEFELNYCISEGGQCTYQKFLKIEMDILNLGNGDETFCFNDCVWAGDTNLDGIVDINDLLPIGLFMGENGPSREDPAYPVWYGEHGENWGIVSEANDRDIKHVDADGEGIITALDTSAIGANYGRTHSLTPKGLPNIKNTIILKGVTTASPGDVIEFDIYMGTEEKPAEDVYGFTFPIEYNPAFFDPKGMNIEFTNNSWLSYTSGTLSMVKNDFNGKLDAGYTRTNGLAASGFGKIGKLSVVVSDDLAGIKPGDTKITTRIGGNAAGSASNSQGQISGVGIEGLDITIDLTKPTAEDLTDDTIEEQDFLLKTYPNPTLDELNVHFNKGREFERVQLFNMTGQRIYDSGKILTRTRTIDMSHLNPGMYVLRVQTPNGLITRKIEKVQ